MNRQITYPKGRIDALTDGIFAVAMTLLVLDVRLPEDFKPQSDADLLSALAALVPRFLPYVLQLSGAGPALAVQSRRPFRSGPVSEASIVAIAWSLFSPQQSPWSFLLVLAAQLVSRSPLFRRKSAIEGEAGLPEALDPSRFAIGFVFQMAVL